MTTFPNTRDMLPSQARAAITSHLLARLEASPLNCYGDPQYTYASVLGELETDVDGYTWSVLDLCWHGAKELYNTRHPKRTVHGAESFGRTHEREGIPVNG